MKNVSKNLQKRQNVAAICAAPMVLGGLGLLDGKSHLLSRFESELVGAKVTGEKVAVDENIITGKGPGFVFDFALQLVETIAGADIRKEVQNGLLV